MIEINYTTLHLVDRAKDKISFGLATKNADIDNKNKEWVFSESEFEKCVEFVNFELKKVKLKELCSKLLKSPINKLIKFENCGGHNKELIEMVIGINQNLWDRKQGLVAMAHDFEYTNMHLYYQFAGKFLLPHLLHALCNYS